MELNTWVKMAIENPSKHVPGYMSWLMKQPRVVGGKQVINMSEEDKFIHRVVGLMQKSKFQPKTMTDLRRQVKQ